MASVNRVQKGFFEKMKENPWVPLGALATGECDFLEISGSTVADGAD